MQVVFWKRTEHFPLSCRENPIRMTGMSAPKGQLTGMHSGKQDGREQTGKVLQKIHFRSLTEVMWHIFM